MIVITIIATEDYAAVSSFKFNVSASKTRLKPGESTIVSMKISDIVDVNNLGINALESVLEYDENILEVVTPNDMEGKNNWTITYNAKGKNFLVSNMVSGIKTEQEIGQIKFKVKDNVGRTKTKIRFKNIRSNDGKNLMPEEDKEIELIIDYEESEDGIEQIEIKTKEKSVKSEKEPTRIPNAGNSTIELLVLIGIIGLIGIIKYIKYKDLKIK